MNALLATASLVVTLAAVVAASAALISTRSLRLSGVVLLDLLTAAGVLHLSSRLSYEDVAMAGAVIVLRKIVGMSLTRSDVIRRRE